MTSLLLDTHVLLWWLNDDPIADVAAAAIADPTHRVFTSAASIWEATIKRSLGKLHFAGSLAEASATTGFTPLPVMADHAEAVGALPDLHRDPFDRMLLAQAIVEGCTIVTRDRDIADYDVPILEA